MVTLWVYRVMRLSLGQGLTILRAKDPRNLNVTAKQASNMVYLCNYDSVIGFLTCQWLWSL